MFIYCDKVMCVLIPIFFFVEKVDGVTRLYWRADSENQSNLSLNEFVEGD